MTGVRRIACSPCALTLQCDAYHMERHFQRGWGTTIYPSGGRRTVHKHHRMPPFAKGGEGDFAALYLVRVCQCCVDLFRTAQAQRCSSPEHACSPAGVPASFCAMDVPYMATVPGVPEQGSCRDSAGWESLKPCRQVG